MVTYTELYIISYNLWKLIVSYSNWYQENTWAGTIWDVMAFSWWNDIGWGLTSASVTLLWSPCCCQRCFLYQTDTSCHNCLATGFVGWTNMFKKCKQHPIKHISETTKKRPNEASNLPTRNRTHLFDRGLKLGLALTASRRPNVV